MIWLGSSMYRQFLYFSFNLYKQLSHQIDIFCMSQSSLSHSWTAARRMWALNLLSCPSLTRRPRAIQTIMLWVIHKCHSPSALLRRQHNTTTLPFLHFPLVSFFWPSPFLVVADRKCPRKTFYFPEGKVVQPNKNWSNLQGETTGQRATGAPLRNSRQTTSDNRRDCTWTQFVQVKWPIEEVQRGIVAPSWRWRNAQSSTCLPQSIHKSPLFIVTHRHCSSE